MMNPTGGKRRVILVEHDSLDREPYRAALEAAGFDAVACGDAASARRAAETPFDAIVSRILLPDENGFDLLNAIAASDSGGPAIVVITTLSDADAQARALARGARYLLKPVPPAALAAQLQDLLRMKTPRPSDAASPRDFKVEGFAGFLQAKGRLGAAARGRLDAMKPKNMRELSGALGLSMSELAPLAAEHLDVPLSGPIAVSEVEPGVLSGKFCRTNKVLALKRGKVSYFAVTDPFDGSLLKILYELCEGKSSLLIAEEGAVVDILRETLDLTRAEKAAELQAAPGFEGEEIDEKHPVALISQEILTDAAAQGASDLHIEPRAGGASVRFRIDGQLRRVLDLRADVAARVISRFKAMASLDIADSRRPQDGSFEANLGGKRFRVRLATVAAGSGVGEAAVVRLLDPAATPPNFVQLGFDPAQVSELSRLASSPKGLMVFAGPTGSGKTTSIRTFLQLVGTDKFGIVTVEDPIEYDLPGAKQLQVNARAGAGFDALLRSAMRLDPDVLYMGEMRDPATAKLAVDFASTGHLTVTTLHAPSAEDIPFRLSRLGIDARVVSEQLSVAVTQRLVPRLCAACRTPAPPTPAEAASLRIFGVTAEALYRAPGCAECQMTGCRGREVVAEIVTMDGELREIVSAGKGGAALRAALEGRKGHLSLGRHAALKAAAGVCDIRAALEQVGS